MATRILEEESPRHRGLQLLDGRGTILDVARDLSRLLDDSGLPGAVIGGVSVVLHGHIRTTIGVDLLTSPPVEPVRETLERHGYAFDPARREFTREGVPVPLVLPDQAGTEPSPTVEIDGIRTVPLETLIAMKLRSGTRNLLRAQDLADVIGLIRRHRLDPSYAGRLPADLRPEFRKLARAIRKEG